MNANLENARKSTGPKTAEGKAIVARNSLAHGIYAQTPVVDQAETVEEWNAYRQAMLQGLEAEGMLEETLAERIILNAWRLRRVVRYETGEIHRDIEEGKKQQHKPQEQELLYKTFLVDFRAAENNSNISYNDARWLLQSALAYSPSNDNTEPFLKDRELNEYLNQLQTYKPCTVGQVRQLLEQIAKYQRTTSAGLLDAILQETEKKITQNSKKLAALPSAHLLPNTLAVEKLMRYETHLTRMFHRDLHELQRLQALRFGQPVAAPVVMDISLTGPPPLGDSNS